ncbi:hypothetical protein [Microbispora sp. NPDC049125]|uniref:hypothetical protein n=1 Tax=Microbispora sp. NPDC049125 TaxID=3154929 RepID=UPI003467B758
MSECIEVDRLVTASPGRAAEVFWDITGWYRIWDRISEVHVGYDDGAHQEFAMRVERDGRLEQVRTLRFLTGSGDIEFVSPEPPPTMAFHRGAWRFTAKGDHCQITAERSYELLREPGEDDAAYQARSGEYRDRFAQRLGRILDCFAAHFMAEATT